MTNQYKANLHHLIASGNLVAVFEQLRRGLDEHSSYLPLALTQLCHYQIAKKKHIGGMLTETAFQAAQNQIAQALLILVEALTEKDLNPFCTDALEDAFQGIVLGQMGKLQLFNCDRQEHFEAFATFFQQNRAQPAQFYFIAGSPAQKPESLAERIIYEIIEDKHLQEDDAIVEYEREAVWLGGSRSDRVKFHPLPLGLDAASSKIKFKQFFSKRMAPYQADANLDTFFDTQDKCLPFKYVAFVFQVESEKWAPECRQYIQWMVDIFRQHAGGRLQFLFFIVLHTPATTVPSHNAALADIEDIAQQALDSCLVLKNLKPVGREAVNAWFRNICSVPDPLKIEAVIDAFAKKVSQQQSGFRIEFDMIELEPLFEQVYLQHLKK